jgi:uncharacterized membrane protein
MNLFDSSFWDRLHGGSTHLPIALAIASTLFDGCACLMKNENLRRGLHSAGFYALLLGTLGAFPAVISGLILTRWDIAGTGATLFHHYFVWPSFALLIALSVWRLIVRTNISPGILYIYLAVMILTAVLVSVAGFWGGEMLFSK